MTKDNERDSTIIVVTGKKGMGMTYYALRLGQILEKEKRTKEGNIQVETTKPRRV